MRVDPVAEHHAEPLLSFLERGGLPAPDARTWAAEAVCEAEAQRRLAEVLLVARDGDDLVGVTTAWIDVHPQLRVPLWHGRVLVAGAHRQGHVAIALMGGALAAVRQRWVDGTDRRAVGMVIDVENALLKDNLPLARWARTGFTFVGVRADGAHTRVVYFPGAQVAGPA